MKKILIAISVMLLFSSVIFGCTQSRCEEPYQLIDDVCCTDENNNQVCDVEEQDLEEPEVKEDDGFEMADAKYDDVGMDIPEPVYEEPKPEKEEVPELGEKRYIDQEVPTVVKEEPSIDNTYDIKKGIDYDGMEPAVTVTQKPKILFNISNIKYAYGRLSRVDVDVTNNMDVIVTPRVHVYDQETDKYGNTKFRRIQDLLLKDVWPGKSRLFDGENIGKDIGHEDQYVKFEYAYFTSQTGLVIVGEEQVFLEGK